VIELENEEIATPASFAPFLITLCIGPAHPHGPRSPKLRRARVVAPAFMQSLPAYGPLPRP